MRKRLGGFDQNETGDILRVELCQRDVESRQKDRDEEGQVFQQPDKGRVISAVGIVVHPLEFLNEQPRHDQYRRGSVDDDRDPALRQLAADGVRTLGDAHAGKQAAGVLILQIIGEIACAENGFQPAVVQAAAERFKKLTGDLRLEIAEHELRLRFAADGHLLKDELRAFHSPAQQGHVHAQRLAETFSGTALHDLALRLAHAPEGVALRTNGE